MVDDTRTDFDLQLTDQNPDAEPLRLQLAIRFTPLRPATLHTECGCLDFAETPACRPPHFYAWPRAERQAHFASSRPHCKP